MSESPIASNSFPWRGLSAADRLLLFSGLVGVALAFIGCLIPWWQLAGGLFTPSNCMEWMGHPVSRFVLAGFAALGLFVILERQPPLALGAMGLFAAGAVLLTWGPFLFWRGSSVCQPPTGYAGPSVGWVVAAAGGLLMMATGIAGAARKLRSP